MVVVVVVVVVVVEVLEVDVVLVVVVVVVVVVEAQTTFEVEVPADWTNSLSAHRVCAEQPWLLCCTRDWNVPRGHVLHSFVDASRNMPSPQTASTVVVLVLVVDVVDLQIFGGGVTAGTQSSA